MLKKQKMTISDEPNSDSRQIKIFVLEDREIYRLLMRHWLEEKNGHRVTFFDSPDAMEENMEERDLELCASHLLPSRLHFKKTTNSNGHRHAVYGDGLDPSTILWCRKSGFAGILDLRDGMSDWNQGLENLANGVATETPHVRQHLNHGHGKGLAQLSRRESEVARMLVKGFSAKQVASALGTSEGTVKNQRKAVYRKLGIIRATQLAGVLGYGSPSRRVVHA